MSKLAKKVKAKSWIPSLLVLGIIVISLAGYFGLAIAQDRQDEESFRDATIERTSQIASANLLAEGDEVSFGSSGLTTTGTPELYGGFTSINIEEELRFGDANTKTDEGISEWLVVIDFEDGTTTPVVFQNTYGETIFIREIGLQVLGKATSTVKIGVTTSTENVIASDDQDFLNEDAGTMTLMRGLGNAFGADGSTTATGTMFWFTRFPGTNTGVSASELPIALEPDVNFLVHATSSNGTNVDSNYGITGSDNTFDGELYLKLERVD